MALEARTSLTQGELDVARLVMTAGCLQLATAAALAQMAGQMDHAATLQSYRLEAEALCNSILTGEIKGSDT